MAYRYMVFAMKADNLGDENQDSWETRSFMASCELALALSKVSEYDWTEIREYSSGNTDGNFSRSRVYVRGRVVLLG